MVNQVQEVFDKIVLQNGEELHGIIDYVNTKHVYFFSFGHIDNLDFTLIALNWRLYSNLRFSVYCTLEFPSVELPKVTLLHRKYIVSSSRALITTPQKKQVKSSIKDNNPNQ